jgi:predicted aldo/keto reductase-like oxidoreductase
MDKISKGFGFGCMRLPVLNESNLKTFDHAKIEALFDEFLRRGFTYFDTAYTYHGYDGELAVKKALTDRYPRSAYQLASKLPLRDFTDRDSMAQIFDSQLERCGVDYFDYYLLHNMGHNVYAKCCKYDAFGFAKQKKAEGKIRNLGMSFHDTPELLEEILQKYGDGLDFLQLQVNYADWEHPTVQSRRCLELANRYGKPVIVMEPCKGGTLANLPPEAEALMKAYAPDASPASWAMRFAAGQPGVFLVLSGMNSMMQLYDNTDTFDRFVPLNDEELRIIREVVRIIDANTAVACTACGYCTHDCPKHIPIPRYFSLYNSIMRTTGSFSSQAVYYRNTVLAGFGKAGDCIGCGKCERACPQHLPIRMHLKQVADKFDGGLPKTTK